MRLRSWCVWMGWLCVAGWAAAQTGGTPVTCADLHLVPAVRECSDVRVIVLGSGADKRYSPNSRDPWEETENVRKLIDAATLMNEAPAPSYAVKLEPAVGSKNSTVIQFQTTKFLDARNLLASRHIIIILQCMMRAM